MPAPCQPRRFATGTFSGHETVLVAEDESMLRELARMVLNQCGYRVLDASSAALALSIWMQHAAEIDLLVTDLMMPQGMSGLELAGKLQLQKPALKVLYTSGSSLEELGMAWVPRAASHFLKKPFTPRQLAEAIRQCLDGRP